MYTYTCTGTWDDAEAGRGGGSHAGLDNISMADTECGHLSVCSIVTPGHPYLLDQIS